jgi:hypothetical protein
MNKEPGYSSGALMMLCRGTRIYGQGILNISGKEVHESTVY